jgi:hypothetical protein
MVPHCCSEEVSETKRLLAALLWTTGTALLILQLEAEYFLNDAKTSFGVATKSMGCAGTPVAECHSKMKDQKMVTIMGRQSKGEGK